MLTDARHLPPNAELVGDVCIIGAGPAGLTIARQLDGSGLQTILLERGDTEQEADIAAELEFASPHFLTPRESLRRQFGGMSAAWNSALLDGRPAARYLPFDPIDLEARYWVPHSGWPVSFDDLRPYYERAYGVCGLQPLDPGQPAVDGRVPLSTPSGAMITRLDLLGPASVFTTDAVADLRRSADIHVVTHAAAVELVAAADEPLARTVVRVVGGLAISVRSRLVIVAAGAIENARLLLSSTAQHPAGLGNEFDNVGRFFMDHPRVSLGHGSFSGRTPMGRYEPHVVGGQLVIGKLKLAESVLRREELLNGNAQIYPHYLTTEQLAAVRSARSLVDSVRRRQGLTSAPGHAVAVGRRSFSMARMVVAARVLRRPDVPTPGSDRWTGMIARSFKLTYQPEQAPSRGNRVTLDDRVDEFGSRIARLEWRWSEVDVLSIRRVREIMAAELTASGIGELADNEPELLPPGELNGPPGSAHHHLGTTRMHDNPRHGVVDRHGRIHGCGSVYVAGGSVFPTGGYANPTLTVVALAIRLADEVRRVLSEATASQQPLTRPAGPPS